MVNRGGTAQRLAVALVGVALAISACTTSSPSPTASVAASQSPAPSVSPGASASAPPSTPGPGARPDVGFATVVADRVNVRVAPSIDARVITLAIADCPDPCAPLQVGQGTPYPELYLLDGPVQADGFDWYLAATAPEDAIFPEYIGWVAAGDTSGDWLVLHAPDCPPAPIKLTDITYALSRFKAIACFGRQPLTVRGWYVKLPADAEVNGVCPVEPGWLLCGYGYHMLRPQPSDFYGDANNLPMKVDPTSVAMPPRPNWVSVTGMFDHPSAQSCGTDAEDQVAFRLGCRMEFVVTEAHLAP